MSSFQRRTTSFYAARHAHVCEVFTEDEFSSHKPIPEYLYIMKHTYRSELLSPTQNIKSFLKTSLVSAVHNHRPLQCINPGHTHETKHKFSLCKGIPLDGDDAVLMHYRRNQSASTHVHRNENCKIVDRSVWRWANPLKKAVTEKLNLLFKK